MNQYPIRILHIFTILNRGGAESMLMNYYRQLNRNELQFDFLVHRKEEGAYENEIKELGGNIYRMPAINPILPYKYYKTLDNFLKLHDYKIIHSHINSLSFYPLKVAYKNNIKIRIAHSHTAIYSFELTQLFFSFKETLKNFAKNCLRYGVRKYANQYFACSRLAGKWLFGNCKEFEILNNAILPDYYIYNKEIAELMKSRFSLNDKIVIGHIGNFSFPKNYPFILKIFKELISINQNYRLLLVGNGKQRNQIEQLTTDLMISEYVIFTGTRNDIHNLLQMMDIMLFPSFFEGLPVTLIEAQAAGVKVIASDSISFEVKICDDIDFYSLNKTANFWANKVLESYPYVRQDNSDEIKLNGYDVRERAIWLKNFYLNQYNK